MAELLVQLQTHPGVTPSMNTVAGDVVVVVPDGWGWGTSEINTPFFGVWWVPGAPVSEFDWMTDKVYGTPDSQGSIPVLLQRGAAFDLTNGPLNAFIDGRLVVAFDTPASRAILNAAMVTKPTPAQPPEFVTLS